jgi:hypothetical protein
MNLEPMKMKDKTGETGGYKANRGRVNGEVEDAVLASALRNFRASVLAWSETEYSRPRTVAGSVRQRSWRLAAGWAMGVLLVVGGLSGGVYERQHHQELARIAAAQEAQHQRQLAEQHAREQKELLARVDSELAGVDRDVSREAPDALEPLAQLMAEDEVR